MSLQITYRQGGMVRFVRTGADPRKILVHDPVLNKRWQRKITEEKYSGELKKGNKVIYKYSVDIDLDRVSIFHQNGTLIDDCSIINEMWD
jgi:hypothetical protein